jgi:RsmE family RNA methyltransferase
MNLILCESHEVDADGVVTLDGARAAHVREVLRAKPGDSVRVGVIDGPRGQGEVIALDDGRVVLRCALDAAAPAPPTVDLLLAVPRPKVLRRLWAQLAALGVGRIILTNASRVERPYFDTHVLDESTYRPLLIEGLQQAGDTRLPRVSIHRQFRILIEDDLAAVSSGELRLVAHPRGDRSLLTIAGAPHPRRVLLAIGPEGGWNAFELELLKGHGFEAISLGPRTLRTDTACIALLALRHETLRPTTAR